MHKIVDNRDLEQVLAAQVGLILLRPVVGAGVLHGTWCQHLMASRGTSNKIFFETYDCAREWLNEHLGEIDVAWRRCKHCAPLGPMESRRTSLSDALGEMDVNMSAGVFTRRFLVESARRRLAWQDLFTTSASSDEGALGGAAQAVLADVHVLGETIDLIVRKEGSQTFFIAMAVSVPPALRSDLASTLGRLDRLRHRGYPKAEVGIIVPYARKLFLALLELRDAGAVERLHIPACFVNSRGWAKALTSDELVAHLLAMRLS